MHTADNLSREVAPTPKNSRRAGAPSRTADKSRDIFHVAAAACAAHARIVRHVTRQPHTYSVRAASGFRTGNARPWREYLAMTNVR